MITIEASKTIKLSLELTETQARYLMHMVQNTDMDEDISVRSMCGELFYALRKELEGV